MQLILALATIFASALIINASPNYPEYEPSFNDVYGSDAAEQIVYGPQIKRGCIPRGGNCDHSAADCCAGTACRCNLWGANCKCQRKGLFTKLG